MPPWEDADWGKANKQRANTVAARARFFGSTAFSPRYLTAIAEARLAIIIADLTLQIADMDQQLPVSEGAS
jgi:hypothetical protein